MEKMKFFKVRTTFFGADGPSEFYFSDKETAQELLELFPNGEIAEVSDRRIKKIPCEGACWLEVACANRLFYGGEHGHQMAKR